MPQKKSDGCFGKATFGGDVGEAEVAEAFDAVSRAIIGIPIRNRVGEEVTGFDIITRSVSAEVKVEVTIVVVVCGGKTGRPRIHVDFHPKPKAPSAIVLMNSEGIPESESKVFVAVSIEIDKEGATGVVEPVETGFPGNIFQATILYLLVHARRKTGRLADEEIFSAVPVDVAN